MSVCKNLEEVFQGYIDQVKKSEVKDFKKEREKHGPDYTLQSKPFQIGDAKIFNLNDKDSGVRENVFQDVAKNLLHQDRRFGNFEEKNTIFGLQQFVWYVFIFNLLYTNYNQCVFIRICLNSPLTIERF